MRLGLGPTSRLTAYLAALSHGSLRTWACQGANARVLEAPCQPSKLWPADDFLQLITMKYDSCAGLRALGPVCEQQRCSATAAALHRHGHAQVLDGRAVAAAWQEELAHDVREVLAKAGRPPGLGVVLVGSRPDSLLYVSRKQEACERVSRGAGRAQPASHLRNHCIMGWDCAGRGLWSAATVRALLSAMLSSRPLPPTPRVAHVPATLPVCPLSRPPPPRWACSPRCASCRPA